MPFKLICIYNPKRCIALTSKPWQFYISGTAHTQRHKAALPLTYLHVVCAKMRSLALKLYNNNGRQTARSNVKEKCPKCANNSS